MIFNCDNCGEVKYKGDMCVDCSTISPDFLYVFFDEDRSNLDMVKIVCRECCHKNLTNQRNN